MLTTIAILSSIITQFQFESPSPDILLKHYLLCHYQGRTCPLPCLYPECVCTFRTPGALKSHLSRVHRPVPQQTAQFNFECEACQPKTFLNHLKSHLRNHEIVRCPFRNCQVNTNVLSTFTSHISRKHKSHSLEEFRVSVTSQRNVSGNIEPRFPAEVYPPADSPPTRTDLFPVVLSVSDTLQQEPVDCHP